MIHKVGIPVVGIPSVEAPLVGWRSKSDAPAPSKTLPLYELACDNTEFVKNTTYTVKVTQIQAPSETMTVKVDCVGGTVTPLDFSTGSIQDLKVTPTADTCTITLTCDGRTVGSFEMRDVLTIPEYIFGSAETEFTQGTEYELIVQRVTAPIKQTQIEVICTGGLVSPAFLVDEGRDYDFEGPNARILVTPTESTCVVTLKVNLAGTTYSVGKFTMKAKAPAYDVSTITINQNIQDPDTMISGDINGDNVQKIVENTHTYLCKYLGEEEGMLICRVENYNYSDGTPADITGDDGDIMIRLPKSSIRCISDDADVIQYAISFNENNGGIVWEDNQLIGVTFARDYKSNHGYSNWSTADYKSHRYTPKEAESIVSNRGKVYNYLSYQQRCYLSILYYAIYGTTRQIFGTYSNFLGMDSIFSDWQELLSGVTIDNRVFKITMPNGEIREVTMAGSGGVRGDYAAKLHLGKYLDIIPKEFGATNTTGFCAQIFHSNVNGAFCKIKPSTMIFVENSTIVGAGYDSNSVGANYRLTYTGKITETEDVEYFKSVPIIN